MMSQCKTSSGKYEKEPDRVASPGRVDSCPVLFQVLIYNQSFTNSFPGLLRVLIWDLERLVVEIVILSGFRY